MEHTARNLNTQGAMLEDLEFEANLAAELGPY